MYSAIDAAGLPAAPGGLSAAGSILRAAVYFDGFNLYHGINELGAPHLKWVNLRALSEKIIRHGEHLELVVWCSASNKHNHSKRLRWREYRKALEHQGVLVAEGHFTEDERKCPKGHVYFHPMEKEGDVNVAIHLISDAHLGKYDVAYLVSADSDQAATARLFRQRFPDKQFITVAPPKRPHSKEIIDLAHAHRSIKRATIEECLFAGPTIIDGGTLIARRPMQYAPPHEA